MKSYVMRIAHVMTNSRFRIEEFVNEVLRTVAEFMIDDSYESS